MLRVGQVHSLNRVFTQEDFDRFARLSGDDNPIHVDSEFSARHKFGRTVAHGMLLLAIYSAGLALPFVIISVFINLVLVFFKRVTRIMAHINVVAGGLLIVIGLMLLTNRLTL